MNISNILMILFLAAFCIAVLAFRKKLVFHSFGKIIYFGMYKTKVGLKLMDRWAAKYPKTLERLCYAAIGIGFIGMAVVVFDLGRSLYQLLAGTSSLSVGLVLPVEAKGVFYVPFLYWITAIAVIIVVHEFAHGLIARLHKIKIKSSGLAFLGIIIPLIPAAFVEPDEKQLRKASRFRQLSVYAAGPFANILLGFFCLAVFLLLLNPLAESMYDYKGVRVTGFMGEESPAEISGMAAGEVITRINSQRIYDADDFVNSIKSTRPGDTAEIKTKENSYSVLLKEGSAENDAFLGVWVAAEKAMKYKSPFAYLLVWVAGLFYWLFLLNLGVGLFNLVPIGPIDGGRMLQIVLERVMHNRHATKIWHTVSFFVLAIIVSNIIYAFVA